MASSEKRRRDQEGPPRLADLKEKVERATKLIAQLREANYSLTGEIADLQRRVGLLASERAGESADPEAPLGPGLHEELQLLRDERKIIRARVQNLLERIEKIEI